MCAIDFQFGLLISQSAAVTGLVTRYHHSGRAFGRRFGEGGCKAAEEQPVKDDSCHNVDVRRKKMVTAATGGMEEQQVFSCKLKRTSQGGHERTDSWMAGRTDGRTDGDKQGEAGVVGAMDQSLPVWRAEQTLFDQLTVMQLKDRV